MRDLLIWALLTLLATAAIVGVLNHYSGVVDGGESGRILNGYGGGW